MRETQGSLSGQCNKVVGVVLRRVCDRVGCGQGRIDEQLGFGIPDCLCGSNGICREDDGSVGLTCAERPPGQSR